MKCQGQVDGHECGRTLSPDVTFCPDCGTRSEKKHTFTCLSCGKALEFGAKFCSTCGTRIDPNQFAIQPVICKGKNDDGSPCEYKLIPGVNFCPLCGTKPGEQDVSAQGNQNSAVKRDVNPDVQIPDRDTGSRHEEPLTQPPCQLTDGSTSNDNNVGSVDQVHSNNQIVEKNTTSSDAIRPEDEISTPDTPAEDAAEKVERINGSCDQPNLHHDEVSTPVACSEDASQVKRSNQHANDPDPGVNAVQEEHGAGDGNASIGTSPSSYCDGEVPRASSDASGEPTEGRNSSDIWPSNFAQYADNSLVQKEIIRLSQTSQHTLNNDTSSGHSSGNTRRENTHTSGSGHVRSDDIRVYGSSAQENTMKNGKNAKDQTYANNSDRTEPTSTTKGATLDHPLKAELDNAARERTKAKGDDKGAEGSSEEGEKTTKDSAEKEKLNTPDAEKHASSCSKVNGDQKGASETSNKAEAGNNDKKTGDSETLPSSADASAKPTQQKGEKTYAQAAANTDQKPSKGQGVRNNASKHSLPTNTERVTVVFHVIISDLWEEMTPEKYQIFLRCRPVALGTFEPKEDKNSLSYICRVECGYLYEGKLVMERHLRNSGFQYKYIAKKINSSKGKMFWETVQKKTGAGTYDKNVENRQFFMPNQKKAQTGVWHRYDGAAYFPGAFSDGLFTKLISFFGRANFRDRMHHDGVVSAKLFLPSVDNIHKSSQTPAGAANDGETMEGYLDKINQVMGSLRHQMLDTSQQFVDEAQVQKAVWGVVVSPLAERLAQSKRTLTLSLFLMLLLEEFDITPDYNFVRILCLSLLVNPDMNNSTCADLDSVASHFPAHWANKSGLAKKVSALIDRSDQNGWWQFCRDPSWLFAVPLLHFLQDKSQPYQDPEPSADFTSHQWWGLIGVERRKRSFKDSMKSMRLPENVVEQLKPALQLDPLFARTLVASLDLEPLLPVLLTGLIPLDVMAATLAHHIRESGSLLTEHKMKIDVCMHKMVTMLKETTKKKSSSHDMKETTCSAQIIRALLRVLLRNKRIVTDDSILNGTFLIYLAFDHVAALEESLCDRNAAVKGAQSWRQDVKETTEGACRLLSTEFKSRSSRAQALQMWDTLLAGVEEHLNNVDLKETVKDLLAAGFEKELSCLSAEQKLDIYLEQHKMAPAFADILNRLAFESLDAAFEMESKYLHGQNESTHLISLLSSFIEGKWQENVKCQDDLLEFVVTWIPMVNYFRRFGEAKKSEKMSTKAGKHVHHALGCVEQLLDNLTEGHIQIHTLQLLTNNRERFLAIMDAAGHDRAYMARLLDLRNHELQAFITTGYYLDHLLEFCRQLIQTGDLQEVSRNAEEIRDKTHTLLLSEVCAIALPDSIEELKTYRPRSNPWKLSADIHSVLPEFGDKITSYIFKKLFCSTAQKMDLTGLQFWRAFHILWSEVNEEWQSLCQQMIAGTITLSDTEKVFSMFRAEGGKYRFNDIADELKKLDKSNAPGGGWIEERIKQFTCFTRIKGHVKAASALLKVKEAYDIEGKFGDVEKICNLGHNRNLPIRDVNSSVLQLCTQLQDINAQAIDCLEKFVDTRCLDFVKWLRENMKDGVKEVNVYVDLAFISAGEEPWAIGRVNCFHAAAIGYAPLIFLEKDKGCKHLLQQCKLVFANVAADPSLPEKLLDSSRYLNWFKDVQKSHGSVEKTSLSQVSNINARGVFRVGGGAKQDLSLHSVIQLRVSEEENSEMRNMKEGGGVTPPRRYTYEELLDLQSRLMLVAGQAEKGKENVDRFITIMESLVRLGKTYVQLCSDGCVLFLDWSVEFLCDMKKPVCCVSEFSSQGKLKGHRSHEGGHSSGRGEDLEEFIAGVAGFLEHCHKEWLQYVDQKRKDYPQLNVYTVEQLVFLQQQLVKVGSDDVSQHVYPMLSLLKADCSPQDLELALQEAMDFIDASQQPQQRQPQFQQQSELPEETQAVDDKETIETFMIEMFDAGFSKPLALRALKEVDVEDVAAGIAWCMEHEDDDEDEQDSETEGSSVDREPQQGEKEEEQRGHKMVGQRLKEWVTRTETITQSAIGWLENMDRRERGTTLKSLVCNLGNVWSKFLETVSSSGMDFLSLEHLGIVLRCLAAKDQRTFERMLPPNFKPKVPNLILCPRREVLNTVTYMYMFPENNPDSLLPQPDEVLLCTENTSFQQVDIFLRRAFFGTQQKVYCLAFADSLDYDVGEKVEKKIKEYTTMSDDRDYKLVVVCATENEYRARIVAAMEKYRRPLPSLSNTNRVRNYLRSRFAHLHGETDGLSASTLDPESLCVRVVRSKRSGVGKTLYKQRLTAKLKRTVPRERRPVSITIPLHGRVADTEDMAACLLPHTLHPGDVLPRIVHLDISYEVQEGVDHLLYNLLVLGRVTDHHGLVWLRSPLDLYLIETMPLLDQKDAQKGEALVHQIFDVLPSLSCWSPQDSLTIMKKLKAMPDYQKHDCLFDDEEFRSEAYQRPFRYLNDLETQGQAQAKQQANVQLDTAEKKAECLATLLKYCGVVNPSWSELTHFVCFLDKQLRDFEKSVYCGMATTQDLPGFSVFVLRFLIEMSRDFATRSLNVSEESLDALVAEDPEDTDIQQYEMRRTWESSPHPYIFFNPDGHSMTFLGFSIDPASGNLVDQQTGQVLEQGIMSKQLFKALVLNRVPLNENFDALPREDRLLRLYRVLGLYDEEIFDDQERIIDPDNTYELTTDNVKKILAIYMRFRCNIPVIVMGETGCGKTRLVKFLCALQTPRQKDINTMVLVKVHGGITGEDILKKVKQAEEVAQRNAGAVGHRPVYTVLFFDEANTTEAIGVIKEVMCDGTLNGQHSNLSQSLKMVAACNPYRKHSDDLIERLENAGLGYHVDAEKTVDKLGRVPMRRLVYRVQPLPQSMLPLVWDFGQLNTRVEELYIRQMVRRYVRNGQLGDLDEEGMNVLCKILMESQEFMRLLADECSFVSLRDVDRALTVTAWFLQQAQESRTLFKLLDRKLYPHKYRGNDDQEESLGSSSLDLVDDDEEEDDDDDDDLSDLTRAVVLALGVCYRACLRSKQDYDEHITKQFQPPFTLPDGVDQFALIIDRCQDVFLDSVRLEDNIARNQALKENVFMMVVCVELRIPLFLVGKPGSSKSLAKTIVSDGMQGNSAYSELFKTLKQAQMVSFQCSPLATADGILGTFRQCAQFQSGKNKDNFVSVVVLDEVGLAEDSPKMPLKTLHPLLEDGCPGDEVPEDSKKVAFIGISNWALDPAKMNRGILVQRDVPDQEELIETAKGICSTEDTLTEMNMQTLIQGMAKAYLSIFDEAKLKREFFGLRDFYSLVKMVYAFAAHSKQQPSPRQLIAAIRRNFGGLDLIDPVESFRKELPTSLCKEKRRDGDPDCTPSGLIQAALSGDSMGGESRYLLLLTENYGGLTILSENLLADRRVVPIFGSSFPKDQEYTQICRNINRIKVCMETGQTVILLNLENLYESLYDALNQYYATLGGERYVDLGLGTHRVKCRVHRQFRLIVVAEKQVVYDKFPIPLINRLEKHFLTLNNIMTDAQLAMAQKLEKWAKDFVTPPGVMTRLRTRNRKEEAVGDAFMGYHPDTAPAIVLKVWEELKVAKNPSAQKQVLGECQRMLLWCATPDAVVRYQEEEWGEVYHQEQQHEHLQQYLLQRLQLHSTAMIMAQVTTHSKLLTEQERLELCESLPDVSSITLLSLQAFDTEQQFCQQLRLFFTDDQEGQKLLLVQCDSGDLNQNLIKCAQYCMQDLRPPDSTHHHVVFIVQLPRLAGTCFTGFLGGNWHCLHIDDLRAPEGNVPSITVLQTHTPAELIMASASTADAEQLNNNNNCNDSTSSIQPASKIWDEAEKSAESGQPEEMEVDVEDVQVQVEAGASLTTETVATEWHMPHPQGFDPRYVKQLFTSCVQAAAAQVRDTEEGTARATHRITVLLHLIEENKDFFAGLHKLVGSILKQKEMSAVEAQRWLSREAAKLDSVNKAGTFRSSWMQYVENKVVPVLAGAVAYLDTNHNLDILYNAHTSGQDTPTPEWVGQLWLGVLQGVCQLNYKQLLSVSGKDELDEFTVRHTGAAALPFSACLPFSWLLWDLVVGTICEAKNMQGEMLDTAGSVVEQSTLGRCVNRALGDSEENLPHLFDLYTCDLLHFTFPLTASQHELLCGCIKKGLQQLHISLVELGLGRGVVALHMLVEQMRGRLQAVLDMSGVRLNAVKALRVGAAGPSAELLNTPDEMTEDIVVLRLLVEEMQPRPDQLSDDEGMKEWLVHYGSVAPVVLRILTDSDAMLVPPTQPAAAAENAQEEEEEEEAQPVNTLPYGNKCQQQLKAIRCLWARATTLKLFLDFVVPLKQGPEKLHKALGKINMKLMCKLLDEEISMKDKRSLAQIDKFLRHANGFMIKGLLGKVGQCAYCEQKFETAPVELPCKHTLCNSCYRDSCHGHTDAKCPQCEKPVPRNFDPSASKRQDREAVELLGRYQGQISGFLMAVVSQLCFAGKEPPEPEAVRHIFGYIIHKSKGRTLLQTKNMTVHDDLIDPTPVLRSFLLRLLLKHSKEEVYSHLDEFLRNAQVMVDQEVAASKDTVGTPTLLEFSLLIIHCLEDLHHEQEALNSSTRDSDTHLLSLAGTLQRLANALEPTPIMLTSLYSLGSLRYALDACVHVVYKAFVAPGTSGDMSDELEDVLTELQELCLNNTTDWPKKFLVKQLCRQYGIQAYSTLAKLAKQQPLLEWIIVQEPANKVEEVADRYLVCSHDYKTIRDQLAQCKLDGDFKDLLDTLQNLPGGDQKELLLLLALHREMTMSVLHPLPQQVRSERADAVKPFIQDCAVLREKALAQQLCNNQLGDAWSSLHVQQTQDLAQQSLGCLLTHLWLTLRPGARPSNLLHPLSAFVFQPATMMNAFLPTMPQDNLQEVLAVLNEKVWQCPNGHRYLIGDCGKPYYEGRCPCGQKIGGARHIAASQNVENSSGDQTQRGHILGSAGQRGMESVPERQLSAVECAVLRFLTHAALYLAASNPAQAVAVSQMVKPGIAPHQAAEFFRQHVQQDMQVLQRVLGRSADDVYLLLHHLCHQMAIAQAGGKVVNLQTKEERDQWEKHFTAKFIAPAVKSVDTVVRIGNRAVVSDTRQGESALLKLVYEDEDQTPGDSDVKNLQANPSVWRYRPRITVDHFFRQFHLQVETRKEMKGEYPVLRLFKAQRHIMHALHYVPSILAGQRRLMMQLHRRLDRAEAATLTVAEVLNGNVRTSGLQELLKNFSQAWEIVKEHLIGFQCVTPAEGLVSLQEEYHNASMTTDSPIAVLLPSTQGPGLCSYILLQFLLGRNNDFLHTYCPMVKQRYESLPEVSVKAVTERQVVGCSAERDVLPLVLAQCNYSLMVGQAATLDYDFAAFQQHLTDSLLQCKARIYRAPAGYIPVETMVFKADTTSSRLFNIMRKKIEQECLSPAERRQIVEDLRSNLPDICQSIDNLNTALSFLKALGGNPDDSLHEFMSSSLRMKRTLCSRKAQQLCKLAHVQSLWVLLCYQRACILTAHYQEAFDTLRKELREELTVEQGKELEAACQRMSIERLELLLLQLFECIMLRLSEPHDGDDDARPENFKLRDMLTSHLEYPLYHKEPVEVQSRMLTPEDLTEGESAFPDSLRCRHAAVTWLLCHAHLANKRHQTQF